MNRKMIVYTLGRIVLAEALFLLLPAIVSLIYSEKCLFAFLISAALAALAGFLCIRKKPEDSSIYSSEGFVIVSLAWIIVSVFGALPFWLSREIPSLADSIFETVSGFTTTGATILTDIESLSRGLHFWRSFTHWIGGMGVLVFVMTVIPLAGSRSMYIMRAEVPGPVKDKLVPRTKDTAKILYTIYIVLTILLFILLKVGGMSFFDSAIHSFSTAGTGGFSNRAASVGAYNSVYIEVVITVFMFLFGINFNIFFFVILRRFGSIFKSKELRTYVIIIVSAILLIAANIASLTGGFLSALRQSSFQVVSVITTTGFATADFNTWPSFSKSIIVLLMFSGACAGSTGGGIKVARLLILFKTAKNAIKRLLHPRSVSVVRLEDKVLDDETLSTTITYFILYLIVLCAATLIFTLENFDLVTCFTSVVTCLSNIGPGLELTGPAGSFAIFSAPSKLLFSLIMLVGRLEIFPILILFSPSVWKKKA